MHASNTLQTATGNANSPTLQFFTARRLALSTPFTAPLATPQGNRRGLPVVCATDFHQSRLSADKIEKKESLPPLSTAITVRLADRDDELEAASWLRARSFYAYPPERKFAGEVCLVGNPQHPEIN